MRIIFEKFLLVSVVLVTEFFVISTLALAEDDSNNSSATASTVTESTSNSNSSSDEEVNSGNMEKCLLSTTDPLQAGEEVRKRVAEYNDSKQSGQVQPSDPKACFCFHDKNGQLYDSEGNPVAYCVELQETVFFQETVSGNSGIDLVSNYIYLLYQYGASVIGILCVLVIVVSGIQLSMAGAIGSADSAKERIWAAVFSLLLLFASGLILKTVNPGFFI